MKTFVDKENWLTYQYWLVSASVMDFKVFEITCAPKGATSGMEFTDSLETAEIFCHGNINRDGCINIQFQDGDCMLHRCSYPGEKFKLMFDRIYSFAADLMAAWADDLRSKTEQPRRDSHRK